MRRALLVFASVLATGALAASAFAGSPHFIASATSCSGSGKAAGSTPTLTCNFKEAGLESGSIESITLSAHIAGSVSCQNGGGNFPTSKLDQPNASVTGTFPASKNGNVVGSLSLTVANPCPPGQTPVYSGVTFSNVRITDNTSGAFLDIPGTFDP